MESVDRVRYNLSNQFNMDLLYNYKLYLFSLVLHMKYPSVRLPATLYNWTHANAVLLVIVN